MNIQLDIDDVVLQWHDAYIKRFNLPAPKDWIPYDQIKDHLLELRKDKSFWLSLETKHFPNFRPAGFVSARVVPLQWTKDTLKLHKVPGRSHVRQVHWNESKIDVLKELKCDIFVDDKYQTFKECHEAGIFCLLMDNSYNQHIETEYRVYDLDINIIMQKYNQWKSM